MLANRMQMRRCGRLCGKQPDPWTLHVGAATAGRAPVRPIAATARLVVVCLALALTVAPALARDAMLCDSAARVAAAETGVPLRILRAIARVETGRPRDGRLEPWPWTVNMEGDGRWFDDRAALLSYVRRHADRGARNFDLGCFQINHRWHAHAFRSLAEMTDPRSGALYAARFLRDLHAETGDWTAAAGAYHSRTPKFARRYEARFRSVLASLDPTPDAAPRPPGQAASPGFPLLAGGAPGSAGSLVPVDSGRARPLFASEG